MPARSARSSWCHDAERLSDQTTLGAWGTRPKCRPPPRGRPETPRRRVRPGLTVLSVNGVPAAEAMDRWMRRQRRNVGYSSERYLRYDAARLFHRQAEKGAKVTLELEELNGRRRTVVLVATTGFGQEQDIAQAREAGFDFHLIKPLDLQKLERLLGVCALDCIG